MLADAINQKPLKLELLQLYTDLPVKRNASAHPVVLRQRVVEKERPIPGEFEAMRSSVLPRVYRFSGVEPPPTN